MKRLLLVLWLGGVSSSLFAFFPFYFGARSLSMGYASVAMTSDINAMYINPALVATIPYSLSGLQYQDSFRDYKNFTKRLNNLSTLDLSRYESFSAGQKTTAFSQIKELFQSGYGISGFQWKNPSYGGKYFAVSVAFINSGNVSPVDNNVLKKSAEFITNSDIAGLELNFIGFHYTQYSLAAAYPVDQSIYVGATVHYLKGQVSDFRRSLIDPLFNKENGARDYLQECWGKKEMDFSRVNMDMGALVNMGQFFSLGITAKNLFSPTIQTPRRKLKLERRLIAGAGFQSADYWRVQLDLDLQKSDLYFNGGEYQPISLGVEKGFFNNLFSIRAGFLHDLTEEDFLGSNSNILYGLGLGFNVSYFQIDVALALNRSGQLKSMAVTGFVLLKGKN